MSRHHQDAFINDIVFDVIREDTVFDLLGDGGDFSVSNLELEDNSDFLLEDGGFIILE